MRTIYRSSKICQDITDDIPLLMILLTLNSLRN